MGENPADTQREITSLRADASAALQELQNRFRGGFRGLAGSEARVGSQRARQDFAERAKTGVETARQTAQENPAVIAAAGAVAVGAVGYAAYAGIERWRESRKPQNRFKRRAREVGADVRERLEEARRLVDEARKRGLLVRVDDEGDGDHYVRVKGAKLDLPKTSEGKRTDVLKNLLWAVFLSIVMAGAGVLARRLAGDVWRVTIREDPPTEK